MVADVLDVVDERRRAGVVAPQLRDLFQRRFRQIPDRMDTERVTYLIYLRAVRAVRDELLPPRHDAVVVLALLVHW